jgi:hypothetical protein
MRGGGDHLAKDNDEFERVSCRHKPFAMVNRGNDPVSILELNGW